MKTLIVGGTWGNIPKKSNFTQEFFNEWKKYYKQSEIIMFNGGTYDQLQEIAETAREYDVIFWMPIIETGFDNISIKKYNPYALVIGMKQNNANRSFVKILNMALNERENMTIEIIKQNDKANILIFDPLGTKWFEGNNIEDMAKALYDRISFLLTTRRDHVHKIDKENILLDNEAFFEYTRECADIFQKTIQHAPGVTRFLGNASFRDKEYIYMSERDVDKTLIDKTHFIATFLKDGKAYYLGDKKPSKDTIVQLNLYNMLKNINYIVHSHCYVEDAPFTNIPVPCGALDEIDEVLEVIKNNYKNDFDIDYYAINLKGHGCLVMGKTLDIMKSTRFYTRNLPEALQ